MSIHDMIQTFFKTGLVVRQTPSPIIQALRDIERTNWRKSRQISMAAIELKYKKQHITPQRLIAKMRSLGDEHFSRHDKILMGVWNFLDGEMKAEEEHYKAIQAGATEVIIPLEIGETGVLILECTCQMELQGQYGDRTTRIELTIFEYNVWTCPRCGKLWALQNMAAVDVEDENES